MAFDSGASLRDVVKTLRSMRIPSDPPDEWSLERYIGDYLQANGYETERQVRTRDGRSRYDMCCRKKDFEARLEIKMRLDASHYRQIDRYLQDGDRRPLVAVGWRASPTARRTLRGITADYPDRFGVAILSDGASLG